MDYIEQKLKEFREQFTYHGNGKWYKGDETSKWFANQEHFETFLRKALEEQKNRHGKDMDTLNLHYSTAMKEQEYRLTLSEEEVLKCLIDENNKDNFIPYKLAKAIITLQPKEGKNG